MFLTINLGMDRFFYLVASSILFDLFKVRKLGLSKIVHTIFVISFAIVDVLGRDGCCRCFFARLDLLSATTL